MKTLENFQITTNKDYLEAYNKSIEDPESFWAEIAKSFYWHKEWNKVLDFDWSIPETKWFSGAKLNITENCLDRHLAERGDQTAIIWEPNDPKEEAKYITYKELHSERSEEHTSELQS